MVSYLNFLSISMLARKVLFKFLEQSTFKKREAVCSSSMAIM